MDSPNAMLPLPTQHTEHEIPSVRLQSSVWRSGEGHQRPRAVTSDEPGLAAPAKGTIVRSLMFGTCHGQWGKGAKSRLGERRREPVPVGFARNRHLRSQRNNPHRFVSQPPTCVVNCAQIMQGGGDDKSDKKVRKTGGASICQRVGASCTMRHKVGGSLAWTGS